MLDLQINFDNHYNYIYTNKKYNTYSNET